MPRLAEMPGLYDGLIQPLLDTERAEVQYGQFDPDEVILDTSRPQNPQTGSHQILTTALGRI
jgi:hypothetical protein